MYVIVVQLAKSVKFKFFFFFDNLKCPGQHSEDTRLIPGGHAIPYYQVYHDRRKALLWIGDPEETQTSDYWGAHPRPDQLSVSYNTI